MSDPKLFTIQPDLHYEIFTGLNADGLQMLAAGGIGDVFVVVYFAADGSLSRFEEVPPLVIEYKRTNSPLENDSLTKEALEAYLRKVGFMKIRPIQVRKFFIPKHLIGVRQYTDSHQEFLGVDIEYSREEIEAIAARKQELKETHPTYPYDGYSENMLDGYTEDEKRDELEQFEIWKESGDYVMWCQNDFWSDADGFIHSS